MLTNLHTPLSSYLVKPHLASRKHQWGGFRTRLVTIRRYHSRMLSRTAAGFLIWVVCIASWQYITTPHNLSTQASLTAHPLTSPSPTSSNISTTLAAATHAQKLPSGPTGQLLPPGTMAPDRTYANTYSRGQCTWYVAGRRQIPAGWGNAASWYYHAIGSGWAVGTTPAIAAVAWTPSGYYGHVALVEDVSADGRRVYISEMNYRGVGVKSFRWAAASSFKYIY